MESTFPIAHYLLVAGWLFLQKIGELKCNVFRKSYTTEIAEMTESKEKSSLMGAVQAHHSSTGVKHYCARSVRKDSKMGHLVSKTLAYNNKPVEFPTPAECEVHRATCEALMTQSLKPETHVHEENYFFETDVQFMLLDSQLPEELRQYFANPQLALCDGDARDPDDPEPGSHAI